MRLSCIPINLFDELIVNRTMPLSDWVRTARSVGFDGIEMYKPFLREDEQNTDAMSRIADMVHGSGLEVSMFTSYCDLALPDPVERERQLASIRWDVDAAVTFGTRIVRLTAGKWVEGQGLEQTLVNIADGLRASLDYAEANGVMLALEDHPQVGTSIDHFTRILDLVGDDRLKVNLDTSNPMDSGDDPVELAKRVRERVVHVHLSDEDAGLEHQVIGEGIVDFPAIFRVLKGIGYDGWLSMESGGRKGEEALRKSMRFVRETWAAA